MELIYEKVYNGNKYDDMRRCSIIHQVVSNTNTANSNPITRSDIDINRIIYIIKEDLEKAKKSNSISLNYLIEFETDNKTYINVWKIRADNDERIYLLAKIKLI